MIAVEAYPMLIGIWCYALWSAETEVYLKNYPCSVDTVTSATIDLWLFYDYYIVNIEQGFIYFMFTLRFWLLFDFFKN